MACDNLHERECWRRNISMMKIGFISTVSLAHLFLGCPRLQSRIWLRAVGHVGLLEVEANRKSVQDD